MRTVVFGVLFYYLMLFGLFGWRFVVIFGVILFRCFWVGCCFVCLLECSWFVVLMVVYSWVLCCS